MASEINCNYINMEKIDDLDKKVLADEALTFY